MSRATHGVLQGDDNGYRVMGGVSTLDPTLVVNSQIDPLTGRLLVDASGGSGQVVTPTGTVNGSNNIFTVPTTTIITSVVVDGLERYSGFGYTYNSLTGIITVDPLAPPVEYIRVNTATVSSAGQVVSIIAGANVTVDSSDPSNPIVSATGTGGGTVDSIQAGNGISVDSTDPANPSVSATITPVTGQYKTFLTVGLSNSDYNTTDYTSDDQAVQAALNALPPASGDGLVGGGTVFIKGKSTNYVFNAPVIVKEGQSILGAGCQATVIQAKNSLNDYVFKTDTTASTHRRNIYMANFKIDGNASNNASGGGIYTFNLRNSKFVNLWVTLTKDWAFNIDGDDIGYFNYIDSCQIDNGGSGIQCRFSEHNFILNNEMSFMTGKGMYLQSDLDFVQGNQLDHIDGYEVHCYFGAGIWTIQGNSFDRPGSDAVVIEGAVKCDVSHNYFDSAPAGTASIKNVGSNQLMCIGNRMTQSGGAGSYGIRETAATNQCMYANNFVTGATTGISLNASSTNVIRTNNMGD